MNRNSKYRKTLKRERSQSGEQIADQTQSAGADHEFHEIQPVAVFSIEGTADSHHNRKQAGSCDIAETFGDAKCRFYIGRCPLCHGNFACAGADHENQRHPEKGNRKQLPDTQAFAVFGQHLNRAGKKIEGVVQRNQCPDAGKNAPALNTEDGKKQSGQ